MRRSAQIAGMALLLATIGATSAAGESTAPPKRGFTLADLKAQIPQDRDGTFLIEISEILNTVTDPEVQGLLSGQPVTTTGQVMFDPEDKTDGKHLRVFRSQLLCCAAHSRQCSVAIEFQGKAQAFAEKSWVRIVGTISYRQEGGNSVPVITAREIKATATPANPILK